MRETIKNLRWMSNTTKIDIIFSPRSSFKEKNPTITVTKFCQSYSEIFAFCALCALSP